MMDKAKAYDEALERARKMLDKILNNELIGFPDQIREIFPQLSESESEDERIRKALIDLVSTVGEYYLPKLEVRNKMFDYLEKQKDPKVDIDKLRRDLYQSGYNDGYQHGKEDAQKEQESIPNTYGCLNCTKLEECEKGLTPCSGHRLKIVDQKPADDKAFEEWIDSWFKEHKEKAYPQITMDEKEFKNFCRGIRNMYQQKSDWNEEDERMLSRCIKSIECSKKFADSETYKAAKDVEINWLKDIYLSLKKHNEAVEKLWSNEEQQGMEPLTKLEKAVFDMLVERTNEITISEKQARKYAPIFLEIAKGEHWKPTKEHIDAIEECLEFYAESTDTYRHLKSLLSELVKLQKKRIWEDMTFIHLY